jgi:hypothetical protein
MPIDKRKAEAELNELGECNFTSGQRVDWTNWYVRRICMYNSRFDDGFPLGAYCPSKGHYVLRSCWVGALVGNTLLPSQMWRLVHALNLIHTTRKRLLSQ